jgi:hypothetical protein
MSEVTATEPVPEPPRDVTAVMLDAITAAGQTAVAAEEVRQLVLRALESGADVDALRMPMMEAVARLAELNADLREIPGAVADATLFEAAGLTAPLAAVPDEPRVSRHSAPRQRSTGQQRALRAVREAGPVGAVVAAFRPLGTALKHSWAAHPVATAATGFTAATLVIGGGAVHAVTSQPGAGSVPAPSASIVSATPMFQPTSPSSALSPSALTKPKTFTAISAPLGTLAAAPVQGTGGGPAPQPSSQGLAPQVTLVASHSLDLGLGSSGEIRIAAFGGPVSWSATASAAGMMLDVASGDLAAGDSAVIGVSITADLQALTGPGSVTIDYGDGKTAVVPVSWTQILPPVPSPTDVVPSEVASALPSIGS